MKKKITIALEEDILYRIDREVSLWHAKNRSAAIESHLRKFYGEFSDASVIIFAFDYKWDDAAYHFDIPKSLLSWRGQSILERQIQLFLQQGITDYHIVIPSGTQKEFEEHIFKSYKWVDIHFYESSFDIDTGSALRQVVEKKSLNENLFIVNWDMYFESLDIDKYFDFHKRKWADFSFCLKFSMNPETFGNVLIQWDTVVDYVEKPKLRATYLTNTWLYISSRSFLERKDFWNSLERDFFPNLTHNYEVGGFIYSWECHHIQSDEVYISLMRD